LRFWIALVTAQSSCAVSALTISCASASVIFGFPTVYSVSRSRSPRSRTMSMPARSATSLAAAGSICCPASATVRRTISSARRAVARKSVNRGFFSFLRPQHSTIAACF
jgi:hypothetical protein